VPANIYELVNITRDENLPATLVCRSRGDPAPDMKFYKSGSPHEFNASNVRPSLLSLRLSVTHSHSLIVAGKRQAGPVNIWMGRYTISVCNQPPSQLSLPSLRHSGVGKLSTRGWG